MSTVTGYRHWHRPILSHSSSDHGSPELLIFGYSGDLIKRLKGTVQLTAAPEPSDGYRQSHRNNWYRRS